MLLQMSTLNKPSDRDRKANTDDVFFFPEVVLKGGSDSLCGCLDICCCFFFPLKYSTSIHLTHEDMHADHDLSDFIHSFIHLWNGL